MALRSSLRGGRVGTGRVDPTAGTRPNGRKRSSRPLKIAPARKFVEASWCLHGETVQIEAEPPRRRRLAAGC